MELPDLRSLITQGLQGTRQVLQLPLCLINFLLFDFRVTIVLVIFSRLWFMVWVSLDLPTDGFKNNGFRVSCVQARASVGVDVWLSGQRHRGRRDMGKRKHGLGIDCSRTATNVWRDSTTSAWVRGEKVATFFKT